MPYLIRITVAVALVAALMVWLLGALPLPLALLLAVIVGWGVFDLLQIRNPRSISGHAALIPKHGAVHPIHQQHVKSTLPG
jgi:uncharacterized membrane protein YraQ (UPF0718 family)